MKKLPRALSELVDNLQRLPGIGPKGAARMAFYLLSVSDNFSQNLAESIGNLSKRIKICKDCFSVGEGERCEICLDKNRKRDIICVVERADEVMAIENVGEFKGLYHVLGGAINPLEHIGPEELKIKELVERVGEGGVEEIIIATNPTLEGEATALYLKKKLDEAGFEGKVTRIGSGLPMGGELGFADQVTLTRAFEGRRQL